MSITRKRFLAFASALLAISIALAFSATALMLKTAWIGIRLGYASFIVTEAQSNMSQEIVDEAYAEAMRIRNEVASESAYASFICKAHITLKFAVFIAEVAFATTLISFVIFLIKRIIAEIRSVYARKKGR